MASSEEVLLQFSAQDNISGVVNSMQESVINSINAIQSAMAQLNEGLDNISTGAGNVNNVFSSGGMKDGAESLNDVANASEQAQSSLSGVESSASDASKATEDLADAGEKTAQAEEQLGSAVDKQVSSIKQNTTETQNNANEKKGLGNETNQATDSTNLLSDAFRGNTDLAKLSAGSAMYLAGQLSTLGTQAEQAAQSLNETRIGVDQVAKMSSVAEDEMTDMITTMSNETFPNDEAIMYTKNLTQMGVASENFVKSGTAMDKINDAFGLGAETTNQLVTELSVLGVDMNNIESSFNALAFANENTTGGMANFFSFLRKYDSQLNELGYDADQTAVIIAAATKKYGGGRAALAGLSDALGNAGSDARALESALDLQSGSLDKATDATATYEGQLVNLANEEMEHKTFLDRLGAAWDDFALQHSSAITTAQSAVGVFGQVGHYALLGNALKELSFGFIRFARGESYLNKVIGKLRLLETVGGSSKLGKLKNIFSMSSNVPSVGGDMGKTATETSKVVKGATETGALAGSANAAGAGMKSTSIGLRSIGSGALSMVAPLLEISVAIMILLPVLALIAAEALVLLKGLQLLIKALDFESVDLSGAIESIKQIGTALWEVGVAMGELSFVTLMTALNGVVSGVTLIFNPVQIAGQMLIKAGNELQIFNDVNIDKSVPDKIKSISESLKLVSDAMQDLVNLSVSMAWGNIVTTVLGGVTNAIHTARLEIMEAGEEIAKIKDVPDLDEGATKKLEQVASALDSLGKAYDALRSIKDQYNWDTGWLSGWFQDFDIGESLVGIKDTIVDAASKLSIFKDMEDVPEGVPEKLQRVASTLDSLAKSMETLKKIKEQYNWDNGWLGGWFQDFDIAESIEGIKNDLIEVSNALKSLGNSSDEGGLADIDEAVTERIKKVSSTLDSVLKAIDTMNKFKGKGGGENNDDFTEVTTTISNAQSSLVNISQSLASLGKGSDEGGLTDVSAEVGTKINNINEVLKKLSSAMNSLKTFPVVSGNEIPTRVQKAIQVISNSSIYLNQLSGTKKVDELISEVISSVGKGANTLKNAVNPLKDFPVLSGNEIPTRVQKATQVISNSSTYLNQLSGVKVPPDTVISVANKVGSSARSVASAINGINTIPFTLPEAINVANAVTKVKSTITELNKLQGGNVGNITDVLNQVSNAVAKLRATLAVIAPGFVASGRNIGNSLKTGVKGGLSGLSGVVTSAVSGAAGKGASTGWTGGSKIGSSMTGGFKSSFNLANIIAGEMSAGLTAITSATPDITNAMGALADQMVTEFKNRSEIKSPGAIAKAMAAEMGYMRGFITARGVGVVRSVGTLADKIVSVFNPNLQGTLNTITGNLNYGHLDTLRNLNNNVNTPKQQRPVNIVIGEGAIQLDARNLTTTESRQIMLNAIEGLDVVAGIDVRGV